MSNGDDHSVPTSLGGTSRSSLNSGNPQLELLQKVSVAINRMGGDMAVLNDNMAALRVDVSAMRADLAGMRADINRLTNILVEQHGGRANRCCRYCVIF
jgi:hypothetical protein